MTDYFSYLFVLVLLYLCECFQKTGPAALCFRGSRRVKANLYPGNGTWGWVVANPLRPGQSIVTVNPLPWCVTSSGIVTNPRYAGGTIEESRWADARLAQREGRSLAANGVRWQFSSVLEAARVGAVVREGKPEPVLGKLFDVGAARARLIVFSKWAKHLGRVRVAMLLLTLVVWPLSLPLIGFSWSLAVVGPGLYTCGFVCSGLFRRAHRELFPGCDDDLLSQSVKLTLYPIAGMRAADYLAVDLLSGFDRSVAAVCLSEPGALRGLLEELYREALSPPTGGLEVAESDLLNAAHAALALRIRGLAEANGIALPLRLDPPAASSRQHNSWCPLCLTQYRLSAGVCDSCRGVVLRPFEAEVTDGKF